MALDLDVDALLHALGKPKVTILGIEYVGRHPSFRERFEIEARWNATDWLDEQSQRATVAYICEKLGFPPEPFYELPEAILTEVMLHFLATAAGRDGRTDLKVEATSNGQSANSESSPPPSP